MHPLDDIEKALDAALNNKNKEADLSIYREESILVMEPVRRVKGKLEISKYFDILFGLNLKAKQI